MNSEEIKMILPHREPMLLVQEMYEQEGTAIGKYHIDGNEWFVQGHFPQYPVVPGVILCEMMAQSASILLKDKIKPGIVPLFTGMNNVRFKNQVRPGDTFRSECRIIKSKADFYFAEGSGFVEDKLCVKAEFSFALMEAE